MAKKTDSLTANHPAIKLLVKRLRDGTISHDMRPSAIHASDPVFSQTNLDNFRNAVKRYKRKFFVSSNASDLIDSEAKLESRSTENSEMLGSAKKRKIDLQVDEEEGDSDDDFGIEHLRDTQSFRPMVAQSVWNEPHTTTKRLTCAVVLPSGVKAGEFSICVLQGGLYLELKCQWPPEIVNMQLLHRKWLLAEDDEKIQAYHPKLLGFEQFFKDRRKRASDNVQSTCRIPLPFQIETHIVKKYNLQWRDSDTRVLYVDLRAAAEEYAICNDGDEFETV